MENNDREKDIQKLCKGVLEMSPISYCNPNGPDYSNCPLCSKESFFNAGMDDIKHELNCVYLIAKDLSTNLKSE